MTLNAEQVLRPVTVKVSRDGENLHGTGFFVDGHHIVTCYHVLVETGADIFAELRGIVGALGPISQKADNGSKLGAPRHELDKDYEILLDALGFEPAGVDTLVARTGFKADEVASMLLILELENRIESYPGGLYVRSSTK